MAFDMNPPDDYAHLYCKQEIDRQQAQIQGLAAELAAKDTQIATLTKERDAVAALGAIRKVFGGDSAFWDHAAALRSIDAILTTVGQ